MLIDNKARILRFVLSALLIQHIHCIFINKHLTSIPEHNWNAIMIQDFGYEAGGTLTVSITGIHELVKMGDVQFAVMPYNLLSLFMNEAWDTKPELAAFLCQFPMTVRQTLDSSFMYTDVNQTVHSSTFDPIVQTIHAGTPENLINKTFTITEPDHYAMVLLRCEPAEPKRTLDLSFNFIAMNPNNQHLSTNQVPLILVSFLIFLLFVSLNFYWAFTVIKDRRYVTGIHYVIGLGILCQTIGMFGRFNHYQLLSKLGILPQPINITVDVLAGFSEAAFLLIMLLVAMGWTITIDDLGPKGRQFIMLSFSMYLVFRILYAFCAQPALCPAYLLSFRVVKFLITFTIIIALNQSAERLRMQTAEQQFAENSSEVFIKLKMMKTFRWAFLIYLLAPLAIILVEYMVVSWVNNWVTWAMNELVIVYMNWVVCSVFCPKVFNVADRPDEAILANAENAQVLQ